MKKLLNINKLWLILFLICLLANSTKLLAQNSLIKSDCNSMYIRDKGTFIESYYFSQKFYLNFSKEAVIKFFRETNLLDLDSLLRLHDFDEENVCTNLSNAQFQFLSKYYSKDFQLNDYLRKHQIDDYVFLEYLYRNKKYRNLITIHFLSSDQTIYSLSESQLGIVYYSFVCYLILDNTNVSSIKMK